jgi:hypothetical protein
MSNEKTYNGWSNYATWRINLECFDSYDAAERFREKPDAHDLADILRNEVLEHLETDCQNTLTLSYALAFVSEVDFLEIAENLIENAEFLSEDEIEDFDDDETRVQNEVNG